MSDNEQLNLFDVANFEAAQTHPQTELIPTSATVPIPRGTYQTMVQISDHCNQCYRCELGNHRTHAVIGRGNPQADIMVIGEAPGQHEDETGLPFVGKSGQLLEKILAAVQLDSETDIFIGNICKCRPPSNRKPTAQEMAACKPYLLEQIRMVNPKILLLAGATAVEGLLGIKQGITKIRGQWYQWENCWCMPVFHPAYLLRNPSREQGSPKWLMWQDVQEVRRKIEELRQAEA